MDSMSRRGSGAGQGGGEVAERLVFFEAASACADSVIAAMAGEDAAGWTADRLEGWIDVAGQEFKRLVLQGHLDLRAAAEERIGEVVDARAVPRRQVEPRTRRHLATVFGQVDVERLAYRRYGQANLYPADGQLNLPDQVYSFGLRRLAALEACRGSFADAATAIRRCTGTQGVPKRQIGELAVRAAADFGSFYAGRRGGAAAAADDVLVLTSDAKGIVVIERALREATRKAGRTRRGSLDKRAGRKRMAQLGGVYDITPAPRTPADIMPDADADADAGAGASGTRSAPQPPAARNKWLTASLARDAGDVIADMFDEADRRDPGHHRTWIALVDGACQQIAEIKAEAKARKVPVTIVIDFIHVIEYLWKAAWCFFDPATQPGRDQAHTWVHTQAHKILAGHPGQVAGAIRRKATMAQLPPKQRADADLAANYLISKRPHLNYPKALASGWPIATGIIEGACRHLVKDRFDITGARWGLDVAEALLQLRALIANNDFDAYWTHHLNHEHARTHRARYAHGAVPHPP